MAISLAGDALLDLLSPPTRASLADLGQRRTYVDGELIHSRGDPNPGMGVVIRAADLR